MEILKNQKFVRVETDYFGGGDFPLKDGLENILVDFMQGIRFEGELTFFESDGEHDMYFGRYDAGAPWIGPYNSEDELIEELESWEDYDDECTPIDDDEEDPYDDTFWDD